MDVSVMILVMILAPMLCGAMVYGLDEKKRNWKNWIVVGTTVLEFGILLGMLISCQKGTQWSLVLQSVVGYGLSFELDGFRMLQCVIASFLWMISSLYSMEYFKEEKKYGRYQFFSLVTLGSTIGVFASADVFTLFVFFELMSMASYVLVAQEETTDALNAGKAYLTFGVLGGLVMLMGILLLAHTTGTLEFSTLFTVCSSMQDKNMLYVAAALLLFGFGAKAGMFPLHVWSPKAYPQAPAPASALLSGMLSKCGIFGILIIGTYVLPYDTTWGMWIVGIGTVTMLWGAIMAVCSIELKKIFACSSMSQIGFILIGVGMQSLLGHHNSLAIRGTSLHMINHSFIKLILFVISGIVIMNSGCVDLNGLRGFGRKKPALLYSYSMAGLGIMGIPLWNGYISKTLLHESIVEYIHMTNDSQMMLFFRGIEVLFLVAGGMTIAYITKVFIALFVEKKSEVGQQEQKVDGPYMSKITMCCLVIVATMMVVLGTMPHVFQDGMATMSQGFLHGESPDHAIHYFAWVNVKGALISCTIGVLVYVGIVRTILMEKEPGGKKRYRDVWPNWLDLEKLLYRPILIIVLPTVGAFFCGILDRFIDWTVALLKTTVFRQVKPQGIIEAEEEVVITRISKNLSVSLLLVGFGLCVAMSYMIYMMFM